MTATTKPVDGPNWDFNPQCSKPVFGPEPSLREVIYFYYRNSGIESARAERFTKEYIAAYEAAIQGENVGGGHG